MHVSSASCSRMSIRSYNYKFRVLIGAGGWVAWPFDRYTWLHSLVDRLNRGLQLRFQLQLRSRKLFYFLQKCCWQGTVKTKSIPVLQLDSVWGGLVESPHTSSCLIAITESWWSWPLGRRKPWPPYVPPLASTSELKREHRASRS